MVSIFIDLFSSSFLRVGGGEGSRRYPLNCSTICVETGCSGASQWGGVSCGNIGMLSLRSQ